MPELWHETDNLNFMPLDKSPARVQQMFGEIAGRYDFLNRLLSLGIDRSWRRKTVKLVPPEGDGPILDVCTGTAVLRRTCHGAFLDSEGQGGLCGPTILALLRTTSFLLPNGHSGDRVKNNGKSCLY